MGKVNPAVKEYIDKFWASAKGRAEYIKRADDTYRKNVKQRIAKASQKPSVDEDVVRYQKHVRETPDHPYSGPLPMGTVLKGGYVVIHPRHLGCQNDKDKVAVAKLCTIPIGLKAGDDVYRQQMQPVRATKVKKGKWVSLKKHPVVAGPDDPLPPFYKDTKKRTPKGQMREWLEDVQISTKQDARSATNTIGYFEKELKRLKKAYQEKVEETKARLQAANKEEADNRSIDEHVQAVTVEELLC